MFNFTLDNSRSTGQLILTNDLTIRNALDFKEAISNAMAQAQHLELNFEEVERIDLTTMQILCAAHRSLLKRGKKLTIIGTFPNALLENVQLAGFANCENDKEAGGLWMGANN